MKAHKRLKKEGMAHERRRGSRRKHMGKGE
jgi:hypothetical protein